MKKKTYTALRIAMWDKGVTQRDIARSIGISDQLMSYYVNDVRRMPEEVKRKIHMTVFPECDFNTLFEK